MKWKGETEQQVQKRLAQWHKYFPLLPIQLEDGTWVWLEWVERKLSFFYGEVCNKQFRLRGEE